MKILVLTWEFPPRIVGGIARHVGELYPEIAKLGHEVHLLTVEFGHAPLYEVVDGVHVHRVPVGCGHDFFHWVVNLNQSMGIHGGKLMMEEGPFDLIHAHDWLVGDAAIALKHNFKVPLVATFTPQNLDVTTASTMMITDILVAKKSFSPITPGG
jgi:glycosyltransferase involved in cell wall biosynthesis